MFECIVADKIWGGFEYLSNFSRHIFTYPAIRLLANFIQQNYIVIKLGIFQVTLAKRIHKDASAAVAIKAGVFVLLLLPKIMRITAKDGVIQTLF